MHFERCFQTFSATSVGTLTISRFPLFYCIKAKLTPTCKCPCAPMYNNKLIWYVWCILTKLAFRNTFVIWKQNHCGPLCMFNYTFVAVKACIS